MTEETFPFLQLPAELREHVYHLLFYPIAPTRTATTPGYPERATAPAIAQTCRQLRSESLHYLEKHHPIEVSLHCLENVRRARHWVRKQHHLHPYANLIFTGRVKSAGNDWFRFTLERSDKKPFFKVNVHPARAKEVVLFTKAIQERIEQWLEDQADATVTGVDGSLSSEQLIELIEMVFEVSVGQCPWFTKILHRQTVKDDGVTMQK